MDWLSIALMISKEGLPLAEAVWTKWASGNPPTAADFTELRALGKQTPRSQLLDAASRAGIPATDPKVVALLAQLP